ncbi:hypothetical protein PF011_g5766 [Phytophthora fragariae]|uniref:Uncharacterized protein n=1 Tax=Phytophthora fragariae TaxID=53985 RepID=A0A6A3LJC3_9STRA|nr:hypothetical protein PF011_g5766 [Phytophthora fragariae]
MPSKHSKRHDWTVLVRADPADDGNMLIEMRVRERRCRDRACIEIASGVPCAWHFKYQDLGFMAIAKRGEHLTPLKPARMTATMNAFATVLAA